MVETVIDQLKHIIVEKLDVNLTLEEIDANISLFEDGLGLDSVIIVEFISIIEEYFCFEFSENELNMELFSNLSILAQFISVKLGEENLLKRRDPDSR
ncbi:MAG: phosphopantetheine-binding protein [Desulfosalsimonadaceae bacterium]|nr:phosphopantetheine-binding protein [Desulfosalsimonadaceae bacterium]